MHIRYIFLKLNETNHSILQNTPIQQPTTLYLYRGHPMLVVAPHAHIHTLQEPVFGLVLANLFFPYILTINELASRTDY